ncbi:hypothetical protein HPB51_009723 [Rhipicephalus microplus]|uniref:Tick transposon n=1 Tax=Rhipicephalus microplus TaxID=6941 RepID=A0A9J6DG27_RHIMP|nr:hypothetical protein HPB51_009723 [Rhipicephalus microplus]
MRPPKKSRLMNPSRRWTLTWPVLLQKKHDLKEEWCKNKLNRHLRTKIADLGREIESHAKTLCAQQWNNTCDEADRKMRTRSKCGLLKHLMADSDKPTRGGTQLLIERLVHEHTQDSGGFQAVLKTLGQKYLPLESEAIAWESKNPSYGGRPQEKLDEPFSEAEIQYALQQLNGRSAPGPDGIDNELLQNLYNKAIVIITKKINEAWETGTVPKEWRIVPRFRSSRNLENR